MYKRIKKAIVAAGAAIFVWASGASLAWADDTGEGGWSSIGGTAYKIPGVDTFWGNILQTIHVYGPMAGALAMAIGWLYMHSPGQGHRQKGIEMIIVSAIAIVGLFFLPQIYYFLTHL